MFALALRLIEHETEQEAFDQLYTRYRGLAFWVAKGYHLSQLEVSHRYYSEEQSHRHLAAEPAPGGGDL